MVTALLFYRERCWAIIRPATGRERSAQKHSLERDPAWAGKL